MLYMEDDEGCAMSRCHAGVDLGGSQDRRCGGAQGEMAGRRWQVPDCVKVHVVHVVARRWGASHFVVAHALPLRGIGVRHVA